jgi:hypothetical protein
VGRMSVKRALLPRAKRMRRAGAPRTLVVHSPFHSMNTCEPKKAHFVDVFYDTLSSELEHARGHASSASCVGPRHVSCGVLVGSSPRPQRIFTFFLMVALSCLRELLL